MDNEESNNKYKLTLKRQKAFVGSAVAFSIYIDNIKVGKIKNGQTLELSIAPGNHEISINKNNAVNIEINGDTTADVVVFGANNFGISNINGQGTSFADNKINSNYIKKNRKKNNLVLYASIILPIISIIMILTIKLCINYLVYCILIGLSIVNIFGLKNLNDSKTHKSLLMKNIISIIICIIMTIITIYLEVNLT